MNIFHQAVENLCGGAHYKLLGNDVYENIVEWFVDNPPTKDQVLSEVARLQTEYDAKEYQRLRANEYPPVVEQLDKIFHEGVDAWKNEIQAIKDKYPKA